ncbi:hypothetical protein D3C72_1592530 [compost metagenome]
MLFIEHHFAGVGDIFRVAGVGELNHGLLFAGARIDQGHGAFEGIAHVKRLTLFVQHGCKRAARGFNDARAGQIFQVQLVDFAVGFVFIKRGGAGGKQHLCLSVVGQFVDTVAHGLGDKVFLWQGGGVTRHAGQHKSSSNRECGGGFEGLHIV